MQLYKRLLLNLLLIFTTLVSSTIFVTTALAVQVSVPSAPGAGYYLISTSTGNYVASSSPVIAPLTITGTGTLGCAVASGSQAGCLSSTDWNTFNNKGGSSASSTLLSDVNTWSGFNNFTAGLGVGTTTLGKLSIHLNPTDSTFWPFAFVIGSSTPTATTTLFSVSNTGLTTLPQLIITGSTTLPTNPPIGILEIGGGTTAAGVATGDAGLTEINSIIDTPYFSYGDYQNVLLQNEALNTTANWTSSVGVIGTNNAIAPDGTLIAENIPAGTLANDGIRQTVVNAVVGNWNLSAWMKSQNPTGTSSLEIDWGTGSATTTGTACVFNLTNQWRRYGCTQSVTAAHTQLDARVQSGTTAIAAFGVQLDFSTTTRAYSGPQTTGATASLTRTNHIRNSLSVNNALTIAGAFNGATTGTFTVTHSAQTLSVINNSVATDTLNIADGIFINNVSAASVATPNQASPRLHFNGRIWNGTASLPVDALMQLIPGSPINTLIPTTTLQIAMSYNGLSTTTPVTITANNVGIGSTSPYAQFAVHANANTQYPTRTLFAIGSSTATATTTLFSILNNGTIISSTTATSTFTNGLNLSGGCFAINSVCLSTSGGSSASSTLLGDTNTWSGSNTFSNLAAFNGGLTAYASTTIGDGTATGGLTINGTATTTGKLTTAGPFVVGSLPSTITPATGGIYLQRSSSPFVVLVNNTTQAGQFRSNATNRIGFTDGGGGTEFFSTVTSGTGIGNVAVGSTSPYAHFSIHANNGDTNQYLFAIGSSTASATTTLFSVDNQGQTSIGINPAQSGILRIPNNLTISGRNAANSGDVTIATVDGSNFVRYANAGITANATFALLGFTADQGGASSRLQVNGGAYISGNVGIGTTTPFGKVAISLQSTDTAYPGNNAFIIASSTSGATTTLFSVSNIGAVTTGSGLTVNGNISALTSTQIVFGANARISSPATDNLLISTTGSGTGFGLLQFGGVTNAFPAIGRNGASLYTGLGDGTLGGSFGVGTTTPYAKFAINAVTGDTNTTLFAIGSSTATATTTLFSISNTGSTTIANGVNITSGCYAVNGTCLALGGTNYWTSSGSNLFNNTGTFVGVGTTTPPSALLSATASTTAFVPFLIQTATSSATTITTQVIITSNQTWTPPANLQSALIEVYGAGGGGGGVSGNGGGGGGSTAFANAASTTVLYAGGGGGGAGGGGSSGSGGGGGGYASSTLTAAQIGASANITIGRGGGGSTGSAGTGGAGLFTGGAGNGAGGGGAGSTANGAASGGFPNGAGGNGGSNNGGGGGSALSNGAGSAAGGNNGNGNTGGAGVSCTSAGNPGNAGAGGSGSCAASNQSSGGGGAGVGSGGTTNKYGGGGGGGNAANVAGGGGGAVAGSGATGGNSSPQGGGSGGNGGGGASGGTGNGTYGMGGAGNGSGNGGNGTDGAVIITETLTSTMSSVMVPALTVNYITATINSNSTTTPAVGIGTSTPAGTLSVQSFWGDIAEIISGFIGSVNYVFQEIDRYGHLVTGGPAPTCGTGCASVTGDDRTMRVVTGSSVSSATVNFANTYTTTPICQATEESGGTVAVNASSTPSGVVLEFASALTTTRIGVICQISSNFTF